MSNQQTNNSEERAGLRGLAEKRCVFCPIITGDAPGQIIERDDEHVVLVPLGPHVPGHVLIVPTYHLPDATTNPGLTGAAFERASKYVSDVGSQANIITSVGPAATQSVPHLHVHVVPRGPEDGLEPRWPWLSARRDALAERVAAPMSPRELLDLQAAFDRDKWAGEWNSLPTAVDRLLAIRAATEVRHERGCAAGISAAQCQCVNSPTPAVLENPTETGDDHA